MIPRLIKEIMGAAVALSLGPVSGYALGLFVTRMGGEPAGGRYDGANKAGIGGFVLISMLLFSCGSVAGYGVSRMSGCRVSRALMVAVGCLMIAGTPVGAGLVLA